VREGGTSWEGGYLMGERVPPAREGRSSWEGSSWEGEREPAGREGTSSEGGRVPPARKGGRVLPSTLGRKEVTKSCWERKCREREEAKLFLLVPPKNVSSPAKLK